MICTCQSCGKQIEFGELVVKVEVGVLGCSAHPHLQVLKKTVDYFHKSCDVAVRR